jgi:site-specific DNA-methyltransferase (cytosine-N4-specific)
MYDRLPYDGSWDFPKENVKQYTHCMHRYPAMMIPQIPRRIINKYGEKGAILFDPYMGTGTSLVEGYIHGMYISGTDLNPLARAISKSKIINYDVYSLERCVKNFERNLLARFQSLPKFSELKIPKNNGQKRMKKKLRSWFPLKTLREVLTALEEISSMQLLENEKMFLKLSVSESLRKVSYQREGEFKQYRIPIVERKRFRIPLLSELTNTLYRNLDGVKELHGKYSNHHEQRIGMFNTSYDVDESIVELESVQLVMTSPPYGDSGTTVAYGQFSNLSNILLELTEKDSNLDRELMGGGKHELKKFGYELIDKEIANVAKKDTARAKEVMAFYIDYLKSIENVSKLVKKDGYVCYVLGNRTVKSQQLSSDKFTAWAFENNGFKHESTIIRKFPSKRMPYSVSPTNTKGKKSKTMSEEFIVILKKL